MEREEQIYKLTVGWKSAKLEEISVRAEKTSRNKEENVKDESFYLGGADLQLGVFGRFKK
jgi:hypothetical protein